jgi:RNA polymerase sigma-70 factor, ECF subfamily
MDKREWELISRVQKGDESAFEELVDWFQEPLYRLAWQWTNNKEDALDICQNAFIKLHKMLGKWKPKASLYTWLYRVVINMAIDLGRKKSRQKQVSISDMTEDGREIDIKDEKTQDPYKRLETKELGQEISVAILGLPVRQQKAFVLKHMHGLAINEIAGIMDCSPGAVKAHIFHATRKMREKLKSRWRPDTQQDHTESDR